MKNYFLFLVAGLISSCSSLPSSHSREMYHFNAQVIEAVTLTYKNSFSIRTEPSMGVWVVGGKDKSFIDSRKEMLKEAGGKAMVKICPDYQITSDYSYGMHISTNTNELITSVIATVGENINPSYDKLPTKMEVNFLCN